MASAGSPAASATSLTDAELYQRLSEAKVNYKDLMAEYAKRSATSLSQSQPALAEDITKGIPALLACRDLVRQKAFKH